VKYIKRIIDQIIKFRYLIALVVLIAGVVLNLNGSSVSQWTTFGNVSVAANGSSANTQNTGVLFGQSRGIRTDEWAVQLPYYLSQAATGEQLVNPAYGLSGQNMVVAYNAPVRDISIIGKPFNWGFLFLNAQHAISFYWCFKIIAMLLLAFEVAMILTKRNKYLSLLGSFWITYTPAVQWWFMQHLGDITFYSLSAMVAIHYFFHVKKRWQKIAFAALLVSNIVGFVWVLYPAFQIPFLYLLLAYFIYELGVAVKQKSIKLDGWFIIAATVLLAGGIIAWTGIRSLDAIKATLNTVYPGHRISTGGNLQNITNFFRTLTDPIISLVGNQPIAASNSVELSSSLNFLPLIVMTLPFTLKRAKIKENILGLIAVVLSIVLAIYSLISIPAIIAKVTLLSYVTDSRAFQAMAVIAVFASIWYVGYIWRERETFKPWVVYSTLFIEFIYFFVLIFKSKYNVFDHVALLFILFFVMIMQLELFFEKKWLFGGMVLLFVGISGFMVNPINQGLPTIYNTALAKNVEKIVAQDKNGLWLAEGNNYLNKFPQIFGARTLNYVQFYPDKALYAKLDPGNKYADAWNRYANVNVNLVDGLMTISSPFPDQLLINLNVKQLEVLKVKYILGGNDMKKSLDAAHINYAVKYPLDANGNEIFEVER